MALVMIIAGVLILIAWLAFLLQGAPYVTTTDEDAEIIVRLAQKYRPKRVLEMGCGNGKVVVLLAKNGIRAEGIELNPIRVMIARQKIKDLQLEDRARIYWGNFWNFDTSMYDLVTMYAIQHIMPRLETKLKNELPTGAYVISNYFEFPDLKPVKKSGRIRVYKI